MAASQQASSRRSRLTGLESSQGKLEFRDSFDAIWTLQRYEVQIIHVLLLFFLEFYKNLYFRCQEVLGKLGIFGKMTSSNESFFIWPGHILFCKSSQSLRPLSRWRFYLWNLFKVVRESEMAFYNQWVNEKEKRSSGWEKRKRKGSSGWEISSNQRCQWGGYVCPALHLRMCLS